MLFGFTEECAGAVVHWVTANALSALDTKSSFEDSGMVELILGNSK